MAKIRTDRLLKLADFLETVPRKKFDIGGWQTTAPTKPDGKKEGSCGFAGCAVGWAVHAKLFRGLSFGEDIWDGSAVPMYRGSEAYDAASRLFNIGEVEHGDRNHPYDNAAEYLFSPSTYSGNPTPRAVAKRIRKFVSKASSSPSGARSA